MLQCVPALILMQVMNQESPKQLQGRGLKPCNLQCLLNESVSSCAWFTVYLSLAKQSDGISLVLSLKGRSGAAQRNFLTR